MSSNSNNNSNNNSSGNISLQYKNVSRYFGIFYGALGIVMTVYNIFFSTPYYIMLSAASLFFLTIPFAAQKVLRFKQDFMLTFTIYLYAFLTFMIGMVFNGYDKIPQYDKIMHTLTGVIFGLCGMLFYYLLKPCRKVEKEDCGLVCWFSVSFSMLVAVNWEILEYVLNLILKNDAQKVAATGINDTMIDIIVCLAGSLLLCIPIYQYYHKNKIGFFMKQFQSFYQTNLQQSTPEK